MTHVNFAMTTLLNGIWEGTFLAVAMWLLLKLLPRLNPTTRFTVLWVTLLAVVALPLGPLTSRAFIPGAQTDSPAIAATNKPTTTTPAPVKIQEPKFSLQNTAASPESPRVSIPKSKPEPVSEQASASVKARNAASRSASPVMAAVEHPLIRIRSGRILGALEIMWALLSLVMLVRLGSGYRELRGLKADAVPVPAEWQHAVAKSERNQRCPPANAIARFEPHSSAHVARISQSGDPDPSNTSRHSFGFGTRTRRAARTSPPAAPG